MTAVHTSTGRQRMVVTGREGQVVLSLLERGETDGRFEIVALGRPELDLSTPETVAGGIASDQTECDRLGGCLHGRR